MAFTSGTGYGPNGTMTVAGQLSGLEGQGGGPATSGLGGNIASWLNYFEKRKEMANAGQHIDPNYKSLAQQNAERAELDARVAMANSEADRARAMTQQMPKSYIHGLGYSGGPDQFTPDYSNMTGNQRAIFMPAGNSFGAGGAQGQASALAPGHVFDDYGPFASWAADPRTADAKKKNEQGV